MDKVYSPWVYVCMLKANCWSGFCQCPVSSGLVWSSQFLAFFSFYLWEAEKQPFCTRPNSQRKGTTTVQAWILGPTEVMKPCNCTEGCKLFCVEQGSCKKYTTKIWFHWPLSNLGAQGFRPVSPDPCCCGLVPGTLNYEQRLIITRQDSCELPLATKVTKHIWVAFVVVFACLKLQWTT